ncbi:MAG: DUF4037 domain-containing protein [Gemmatimonadetes bacterium]|jgi:hypothetical protein|nr:DUF4037 domain-containing protein [Gemmatimonadota bacterium]MBT7913477.1 DUF4037 domain-containing protein [Candidatus Bathyarchaeota archaeon]
MTPESRRWTKLAAGIAEGYTGDANVEGIVLGGSVARGHADANSDVDIFVFCRKFPSDGMRKSAVVQTNGERWKCHNNRRDTGVLRDCFWADGGRIDVEFVLTEAFEAIIRDVLVACDISRSKQGFLGGLLDARTLYGDSLISHWRERIEQYPDALQKKVVESHLFIEPLWIPEIYAGKRGDLLYLCDAICRVSNDILGVLFGLNRLYQPTEYKRLDWLTSKFKIAPINLATRLREVLEGTPLEGVKKIEQITEEMFALVKAHMPSMDISAARAEFTTDTDTEPE